MDSAVTLYLLSISLGPVQEFIAASRRVRDLAAGSRFLTLITGAVAQIFPEAEGMEFGPGRVFPVGGLRRVSGDDLSQDAAEGGAGPTGGGANKILAIVTDPEKAVARAKETANAKLQGLWRDALDELPKAQREHFETLDQGRALRRAQAQLATFLEIQAAWTPVEEQTYSDQRNRVERLLAGRKALRDFAPAPGDDAGLFKSALDPSRPSVVTEPFHFRVSPTLADCHPLWLKQTEALDAVSLMKRLLGQRWFGAIPSTRDLAQRAREPGFRLGSSGEDRDADDDSFAPDYPYYCVVQADGDHMGQLVDDCASPDQHRRLSQCLDDFARRARQVIRQHDGEPIYCGGDDVLALVPVVTAVACADRLRRAFAESLDPAVAGHEPPGRRATLSVGIAVAHYREPLSVALGTARQAEKGAKDPDSLPYLHKGLGAAREAEGQAKVPRNACAVVVRKRGGPPLVVRQSWGDAFTLPAWIDRTRRGLISHGVPHALRRLADQWPPHLADGEVLRREVARIMSHSEPAGGADPNAILDQLPALRTAADLRSFVALLATAGFFFAGEEES